MGPAPGVGYGGRRGDREEVGVGEGGGGGERKRGGFGVVESSRVLCGGLHSKDGEGMDGGNQGIREELTVEILCGRCVARLESGRAHRSSVPSLLHL